MARRFGSAGVNNYLAYTSGAVVSGLPLTMACWATVADRSQFHSLVNLGSTASDDAYLIFVHTNGQLWNWDHEGPGLIATVVTSLDVPFHACAVFSASERRMYLNGGNKGTGAGVASAQVVNSTAIGAQHASGSFVNFHSGLIWEVGIWNVALTDEEVAALSRKTSPDQIRPQALVGYWPLLGSDSPEPNRAPSPTGNQYPMTLYGTTVPAKADHGSMIYRSRPKMVARQSGLVAAAAAVALAIAVPAHTLVAELRADASPVEVAVGVPTHTGITGPPPIAIAVGVPDAVLVEGPRPVGIAVAVPAHTLYQGAFTIPIAVGLPAVTFNQALEVAATGIAVGVPTPLLRPKPAVTITVGGVVQRVRMNAITLTEALNHEPDTAAFRLEGYTPHVGQPVTIELRDTVVFAGSITRSRQGYEGQRRERVVFDLDCQDYGWLLDRRLVNAQYTATAADVIATDILTRWSSGFSWVGIVTGLPAIDEIQFTDATVGEALTQTAKRIGAYWYVDPTRDVHFFLTEAGDNPAPITDATLAAVRAADILPEEDLTQVHTRVIVEGGGSNATAEIPAGATELPVTDPVWYSDTGGRAKTGTQRLTYAGLVSGVPATTVRGADAPTFAPTAALASDAQVITAGVGEVLGTVRYRVTLRDGSGETTVGPASNAVTVAAFPAPTGAPSLSIVGGQGRLSGTYNYATAFVTKNGDTTLGPAASIAPSGFSTPSAPSSAYVTEAGGGGTIHSIGRVIGTVTYKVGYVTANGETLPSSASSSLTTAPYVSPVSPNTSETSGVTDLQGNSAFVQRYLYKMTFVTADGETLGSTGAGPAWVGFASTAPTIGSVSITSGGSLTASSAYNYRVVFITARGRESGVSNNGAATTGTTSRAINLSFSSGSGVAGVVGKRIYRTRAGGSTYYLLAEIRDTSTSAIVDGAPDDNLQIALGTTPTAGNAVTVSSSGGSSGAPAGTVARRFYRTKYNDFSAYYFIGEVTGSGGTIVDIYGDLDLGSPMPLSTALGDQVTVTIPTGPSGTLARRVYRATAGGPYRQVAEVQNNSTTSIVDNVADPSGPAPMLVSTAGGQNVQITPPQGPAGTTARDVYRTKQGESGPYYLAGRISNNTGGAVFVDSKTDDELGVTAAAVSTAGGGNVTVSVPYPLAAGTSARLYRTKAGGAEYFFLAEIPADEAVASVEDDRGDDRLGEGPPTVSTYGTAAGATTLRLTDLPAGLYTRGWVTVGSQPIQYGAISGSTLTGIPASGVGAILTPIRAGVEVLAAPMLTGIPASGAGAIAVPVKDGDPVNIEVERDDLAAQAALAALEGGDGIHEFKITDNRLSIAGATARADAELAQLSRPIVTVTYKTRDPNTRVGREIEFNLGAPTFLVGTFKIQRVSRSQLGLGAAQALCDVTASSVKISLEDVLQRRLRAA